ncbi:MAG TPA: ECF-type sigma factor [Pyrinomonadaceae bacterium]|nr:ECF-type sigma factor [Pyrinomonadaceae bacterium]
MTRTHEITDLLQAWTQGDREALEQLLPLVDHELKRIAHAFILRERSGHTLQTNDLVNEALLSLIADKPIDWKSRKHFYAIVAWRMRKFLIEYARARQAAKRRQDAEHIQFDEGLLSDEASEELIMLDEALTKLAKIDERKAKVVELHHFGGFTLEEIGSMLGVAKITVERDWRFARSWLRREVIGED